MHRLITGSVRRFLVLGMLCAGLAACAKSPKDAYVEAYRALEQGKLDEAAGYFSESAHAFLGSAKLRMVLAMQAEKIQKCGGIRDLNIDLQGEGDVRTGKSTITFKGDCAPVEENVRLVRENDQWKVGLD